MSESSSSTRRFLRALTVAVRNGAQSFRDYYHNEYDPLTRDGLTRVYNRPMFERRRTQLYTYALILLDIDKFKSINDQYGHSIGDVVLREIASVLRIDSGDRVFRIGGEEFAVILAGCQLKDATRVAERLCRQVSSLEVLENQQQVTVSAGVAWAGDPTEHEATFRRADQALYHAKANGRNRVSLYDRRLPLGPLPSAVFDEPAAAA